MEIHPKGAALSYDSVPCLPPPRGALRKLSTGAPCNSDPLHRPNQDECGLVGSARPPISPGPFSAASSLLVTPPACLCQSQWKNRCLLLACPEKRDWGLIKVQSSVLTPPLEHEILGFGHRLFDTYGLTCHW